MEDTNKALEGRMTDIEDKLDKLIGLVQKIEQGVFGDDRIGYPGVIKNQEQLKDKIFLLEKKIADIERKNVEQDIALQSKKKTDNKWIEWGKIMIQTIIQGVVIYAVLKGAVGADALLK